MLVRDPVMPTIPVNDLDRAKNFYRDKLGLKPAAMPVPGEGAVFDCGDGNHVYLYRTAAPRGGHTLASFLVDNIEEEMRELRQRGVSFEEYDLPELKTVNGIAQMGDSKSAWFKDTEGNILALSEIH